MSSTDTPTAKAKTRSEKALRQRLVQRPESPGVRQTLYDIIFEADTPAGRWFDIALLIAIVASIVFVSLETVPEYQARELLVETGIADTTLPNVENLADGAAGEAAAQVPRSETGTTVGESGSKIATFLSTGEWLLTILFTIEYLLRLLCVRKPLRYAFSFWGIVDLLSILPSYLTLVVGGSAQSFCDLTQYSFASCVSSFEAVADDEPS